MTREELFRAVGEVREDQITEAEAVEKRGRPWRWLGVLAACLVLTATTALAAPWIRGQPQWKSIIYSFNPGAEEEVCSGEADAGGEDLEGSSYWWADDPVQPISSDCSTGVEIGQMAGPGDRAGRMEVSSCMAWLAPEEILAQDTEIFRGTIRELQYFQVDLESAGMEVHYTRAIVEVTDVIRGNLKAGETYSLLWLGARGYMTISISGPLEDLDAGDEAIFMPIRTDEATGWQEGGSYFCYRDLAELYLSEGMRFVFADTGDGLEFERGVYEEIAEAKTLDEVADYIRRMLETEGAQPAAAPRETAPEIDPALADPFYFPENPTGAGEK